LKKALAMTPEAVVDVVKASGLRGRGGAGFPTGMKWQFVDKKSPKPKYICCNADESEPGTFKDHVLMERNPHLVFEGCLIGCHAIGAKVAYIYIRGEFHHVQEVLEAELAKARAAGFVGKNIFGTGFDCEIFVHRGAGAYEAGEETALIESLEGKRAQPRLKPPFPAVAGLYGCPTAVNNVETLCNVPPIITNGPEWFAALGPEKNGGPKLYCLSGHVKNPGVYEAPMHVTMRELIYDDKYGGGIRGGHKLKAVIPGGSSVPILLPDQLDIPASFDGVAAAGSMLGSAGIIVMDETTCMVWAARNLMYFYKHESCGKCTPCREGGDWLHKLLVRIEAGEGQMKDIDLLQSVANNIMGKTLCAFGDAAATPVLTTVKLFREEYEAHVREKRCTLPSDWRAASRALAAH
ncbi:MAG: NADH-quinone oxidoreductase subunit NuoF, partial [Acidobacteria bacterium]|nr:NADH-quinone oxidoreductase subunit NuoF [Acidobacteriota bacterium]